MRIFLFAACALILAACGTSTPATTAAQSEQGEQVADEGLPNTADPADINQAQLGVNGYLWRASLDTLNFMPLASADPIGGVIITEWFAAPETPTEQMKVTAYILDRRLRADAVRVTVFRQVRGASGWVYAPVNPGTGTKLEDAILARARELRLASVGTE